MAYDFEITQGISSAVRAAADAWYKDKARPKCIICGDYQPMNPAVFVVQQDPIVETMFTATVKETAMGPGGGAWAFVSESRGQGEDRPPVIAFCGDCAVEKGLRKRPAPEPEAAPVEGGPAVPGS